MGFLRRKFRLLYENKKRGKASITGAEFEFLNRGFYSCDGITRLFVMVTGKQSKPTGG